MIIFRLNTHSGVPPYLQLVQQVKHALQIGTLQAGDQLPTVKEVVSAVAINPNTVFKAYHELEKLGLVEGRVGSGTFVTGRPAGPPPQVQQQLIADLDNWIASAKAAGLDSEAIAVLVREATQNID